MVRQFKVVPALAARGRSAQTARNLLINRLESTQIFRQHVFCHGLLGSLDHIMSHKLPSVSLGEGSGSSMVYGKVEPRSRRLSGHLSYVVQRVPLDLTGDSHEYACVAHTVGWRLYMIRRDHQRLHSQHKEGSKQPWYLWC